MQKRFSTSSFFSAIIWGFIFLIPLITLELVNRWKFHEGFPFALFTFTWILQVLFILLLTFMIKSQHSRKSIRQDPTSLLLQVIGLLLIAYIWGGWIIDQWPCLMGIPNCD